MGGGFGCAVFCCFILFFSLYSFASGAGWAAGFLFRGVDREGKLGGREGGDDAGSGPLRLGGGWDMGMEGYFGGIRTGGGAALCFIFMRVFCCCFLLLSLLLVDVVDALTLMHSRGYERMAFAIYTSWLCCFVKGV